MGGHHGPQPRIFNQVKDITAPHSCTTETPRYQYTVKTEIREPKKGKKEKREKRE